MGNGPLDCFHLKTLLAPILKNPSEHILVVAFWTKTRPCVRTITAEFQDKIVNSGKKLFHLVTNFCRFPYTQRIGK